MLRHEEMFVAGKDSVEENVNITQIDTGID